MLPGESPFTNAAELRELPFAADGSFAWLIKTPTHKEWAIGERQVQEIPSQLASVIASARSHGVALPEEFVTFIGTPTLHDHVRSTSACFLDVAEAVLPFENGHLVRFLADQQGCGYWYLYVEEGDHCVVGSPDFFDADDMNDEDDLDEASFQFCGESFVAFLMRFWLENEVGFAGFDSTPMPNVNRRFIDLYSQ